MNGIESSAGSVRGLINQIDNGLASARRSFARYVTFYSSFRLSLRIRAWNALQPAGKLLKSIGQIYLRYADTDINYWEEGLLIIYNWLMPIKHRRTLENLTNFVVYRFDEIPHR